MADRTKYLRLFDLHRRFMTHARLTIPGMMADYGINRRTANRDLNDLIALGVRLEQETTDNGLKVWFLPASDRKISIAFNQTDLTALFMGQGLFDFLKGTLLEESLNKIYDSVETRLDRHRDFVRLKDLKRRVYVVNEGPKQLRAAQVEQLDELLTGLLDYRLVAFTYRNAEGTRSRHTVAPYTLVAWRRGLYLLACPEATSPQDTRLFAVERISRATALRGTSYQLPRTFSPEEWFKDALFLQRGQPCEVKLLFSAGSAPFISMRKFHHSQKTETLADGRIRMTLLVPAGDADFEILNWIMGFHRHVEVISPPSLRRRVKECLAETLSRYD